MMQKRIHQILNTIIAVAIGVLLGHSAFLYWDVKNHPDLYAAQSAPWYTGIFVYGACTAVVIAVVLLIKYFLRRKGRQ